MLPRERLSRLAETDPSIIPEFDVDPSQERTVANALQFLLAGPAEEDWRNREELTYFAGKFAVYGTAGTHSRIVGKLAELRVKMKH